MGYFYSPCTFNKPNPKPRPNKVIKKQIIDVLTISALAYGNMNWINSIILLNLKIIKSLNN